VYQGAAQEQSYHPTRAETVLRILKLATLLCRVASAEHIDSFAASKELLAIRLAVLQRGAR
jgi:hypothetical protein